LPTSRVVVFLGSRAQTSAIVAKSDGEAVEPLGARVALGVGVELGAGVGLRQGGIAPFPGEDFGRGSPESNSEPTA
jgi:hypothetical protein